MSRERLTRHCLAYLLQHGLADLSLRPLGAAVGTSARMLVHHFGSKEGLITAVMAEARAALQARFQDLSGAHHSQPRSFLLEFWKTMTSPAQLPYLRLLLEVQVLAIQNPRRYRKHLRDTSESWVELVAAALPPGKDRAARAILCVAVIDGLVLELLSSGNRQLTTRALELFLEAPLRAHDQRQRSHIRPPTNDRIRRSPRRRKE